MPKLIPNWRQAWRMFSVQAQASSVAILGAWQALPDDLRAKVPESVVLGIVGALLVFGIVGRLIDQPATRAASDKETQ
jgi:hypothetical protein